MSRYILSNRAHQSHLPICMLDDLLRIRWTCHCGKGKAPPLAWFSRQASQKFTRWAMGSPALLWSGNKGAQCPRLPCLSRMQATLTGAAVNMPSRNPPSAVTGMFRFQRKPAGFNSDRSSLSFTCKHQQLSLRPLAGTSASYDDHSRDSALDHRPPCQGHPGLLHVQGCAKPGAEIPGRQGYE